MIHRELTEYWNPFNDPVICSQRVCLACCMVVMWFSRTVSCITYVQPALCLPVIVYIVGSCVSLRTLNHFCTILNCNTLANIHNQWHDNSNFQVIPTRATLLFWCLFVLVIEPTHNTGNNIELGHHNPKKSFSKWKYQSQFSSLKSFLGCELSPQ